VDLAVQGLVDELGRRVLAVSENKNKAGLYRFVLADVKGGFSGLSLGDHLIYINYEIASKAASVGRDSWPTTFLLMVLAHEIGHDVMGHVPNRRALVNLFTAARGVASGLSYVPGPIGWIGAGASWGLYGAGAATTQLYSRSQEMEADRKAIEYWKRMGLDCQVWVRRFQALADRGIKGDFQHPTEGRLEQAKALCPLPPARK
jgi:predicted Zn-dependent protease